MNKSKSLPWDEVEKAIYKEIKWLEDTIMESHFKHEMEVCSECIFRRIAVLIEKSLKLIFQPVPIPLDMVLLLI